MSEYLIHYGIKGMHWGVRRYQNADGSLTDAGRKRLYKDVKTSAKTNNAPGFTSSVTTLHDRYSRQFDKGVKASEKFWYDAFTDKLDYTKGSPEWQSIEFGKRQADELLGKYANKRVKVGANHRYTETASEYVARIMDLYGSEKAIEKYNIEAILAEQNNP